MNTFQLFFGPDLRLSICDRDPLGRDELSLPGMDFIGRAGGCLGH